MFGASKPVVFDPYRRRRSRWRLPRWLVLLLAGAAIGAAGVVFVQERYLPPRLSADAGAALRSSFERAESERLRLKGELAATTARLQAALADSKSSSTELAASRALSEALHGDLGSLVALLPADPRGGAVQVRAARFAAVGRKLVYDVVLSRERPRGKALDGVMQLIVAGAGARGAAATIKLPPVAVSLMGFQSLHGSLALPEGFDARQATIHVLDGVRGTLLGMRVMNVDAPDAARSDNR